MPYTGTTVPYIAVYYWSVCKQYMYTYRYASVSVSIHMWLITNFIPFVSNKGKVGPVNLMKSHGVCDQGYSLQPTFTFLEKKKIFEDK